MTREEAQQAWEKMRSEIDKENWLFVGTINPQMVDIAIEALKTDIVLCGECSYMMPDGRCYVFADDAIRPSASDFCSYGEREDNERHNIDAE